MNPNRKSPLQESLVGEDSNLRKSGRLGERVLEDEREKIPTVVFSPLLLDQQEPFQPSLGRNVSFSDQDELSEKLRKQCWYGGSKKRERATSKAFSHYFYYWIKNLDHRAAAKSLTTRHTMDKQKSRIASDDEVQSRALAYSLELNNHVDFPRSTTTRVESRQTVVEDVKQEKIIQEQCEQVLTPSQVGKSLGGTIKPRMRASPRLLTFRKKIPQFKPCIKATPQSKVLKKIVELHQPKLNTLG